MGLLPNFTVRLAEEGDAPSIEELIAEIFRRGDLPHKEGDIYLIAERGTLPVGFCHFRFREKSCFIAGLGVRSQYRNKGIGTMLLAEALRMTDAARISTTVLRMRAANTASSLYSRFGFFERKSGETLVLERKKPS